MAATRAVAMPLVGKNSMTRLQWLLNPEIAEFFLWLDNQTVKRADDAFP